MVKTCNNNCIHRIIAHILYYYIFIPNIMLSNLVIILLHNFQTFKLFMYFIFILLHKIKQILWVLLLVIIYRYHFYFHFKINKLC